MTEKQYTYLNASKCNSIGSFFCNGISLTNEEVVDLLNENEQLKKDWDSVSHNWALMYSEAKNKVEELSKENKKLKSINNQLKDRLEESGIGIALKIELGRNYLIKLEFEQKVKDTLQAFIRGIEDEKGIDKDNEQFQKSMDCALKYLKRLSEELGIDFE